MNPKLDVSIIVTCFNKEKYLNECMESIKRQTRQPKEVILIHDECDEPMAHVIATTIILPKNVGVSEARDIGFKYSVGKLILFVDADDVLSPDYLEKMALVLSKGADIVYPDLFIWNAENSKMSIPPMQITKGFVKRKKKVPIPVTSMMNRKVYKRLGGFKKMEVLEDIDFFVRALIKGYVIKKAQTLLWYRRSANTRNSLALKKREEVLANILAKLNG